MSKSSKILHEFNDAQPTTLSGYEEFTMPVYVEPNHTTSLIGTIPQPHDHATISVKDKDGPGFNMSGTLNDSMTKINESDQEKTNSAAVRNLLAPTTMKTEVGVGIPIIKTAPSPLQLSRYHALTPWGNGLIIIVWLLNCAHMVHCLKNDPDLVKE